MVPIETWTAPTETKEALFIRLYQEVFPDVAGYVARRGGSLDDARDIFQEALVVYYEKVLIAGFQPAGSHQAYLFGIARHFWSRMQQERSRIQAMESMEVTDSGENQPVADRIMRFLQTAGQKCMDLLHSFYYEKRSMGELAQEFGFASERSATVQKYKCLEKVREEVRSKSMSYEDFTD